VAVAVVVLMMMDESEHRVGEQKLVKAVFQGCDQDVAW